MVRLNVGEISFLSESSLYELTVYMKTKVMALKAAAQENVPGIGEELVHSWALSPFLDSFSVCLWDVRRQARTMSAPSEGKHAWGPRKVDLFFFLLLRVTPLSFTGTLSSSELCPSASSTSPLSSQTSASSNTQGFLFNSGLFQLEYREWLLTTEWRLLNLTQQRCARTQKTTARKFRQKSTDLLCDLADRGCIVQGRTSLHWEPLNGSDSACATMVLSFTCSVKLLLKALFFMWPPCWRKSMFSSHNVMSVF